MNKDLKHYGIKTKSGRYEWGSGEDPYQRLTRGAYLSRIQELKKAGLTEKERADALGISINQLRARISISQDEIRQNKIREVLKLKDKGYSTTAIGKKLGMPESTVRSYLNPVMQERANQTMTVANILKDEIAKKKYIDVGVGTENNMNITRNKLQTAVAILKEQGYEVYYIKVTQLGTGHKTTIAVLSDPKYTYSDVYKDRGNIGVVNAYTEDHGRTFNSIQPPTSISSDRIEVRYKDDGGAEKDGLIEVRRGIPELSLDSANYAQVRIAVDNSHFLKGMVVYSDNLPKGVDVRFNTNKERTDNKLDAMKSFKDENERYDPNNPFSSAIRQKHYIDANGNKQLSALNIINEEGDWSGWSNKLSSQMLSKQPPSLIKKQLELTATLSRESLDEIKSLTNPVVKEKLLMEFADGADADAVHLKAAALPRTINHVIIPFNSIKDNEVYAPNYRNGEKVVLIRHPHGGIFEIPELTVNNNYPEAKKTLKGAIDAVGINSNVANRLSGADFDGDTVLVIPNPKGVDIKTSAPLKDLKGFDPIERYKGYEGMPVISEATKNLKMGDVSNLITDMTIKGAHPNEIAKAVAHSMVVIDAHKHKLNYKQSYIDNNIAHLKEKYQGGKNRGASTIVSRAKSEERTDVRKEIVNLSPNQLAKMTPAQIKAWKQGEVVYEYTPETYINKKGVEVSRTTKSNKMMETKDAFTLVSRDAEGETTREERLYATHANQLKAMANEARKEARAIVYNPYSPSAKKTYQAEVDSLNAQLNLALRNKPLERKAQAVANSVVAAQIKDNPGIKEDKDTMKKLKAQALSDARLQVGAKKVAIDISDREWEAIQAGAITRSKLQAILTNTDPDKVKKLATPRTTIGMTATKIAMAKSMLAKGYTQAEVADHLGVSVSTILNAIN